MRKRTLGIIGIAVVFVIASVVALVIHNHTSTFSPTTYAAIKAQGPAHPVACMAEKDDPNLQVSSAEQQYISNAVASSLIDVSAGTNVDIHLKAYDGNMTTGSAIYAGKYGTYNFTAKKDSKTANNTYVGGWTITQFVACKV